jgi:nitroreductase
MDVLTAIMTRTTVPPLKMGGPGPDQAALDKILAAGAAAPDHGRIAPYRFFTVTGVTRERLGELFVEAARASDPTIRDADLEKQRRNPTRATAVIVVVAKVRPNHPKFPAIEQEAAAEPAIENMLLAAHGLGFAGKWVTGKNAYDPMVRKAFGCAEDDIIMGIVFLGSLIEPHATSPKPAAATITLNWTAPLG